MGENVDRDQLPAILDEGVRSIGIDPEDLPDGNYPRALDEDDDNDDSDDD